MDWLLADKDNYYTLGLFKSSGLILFLFFGVLSSL
jgi:hypothetical protein